MISIHQKKPNTKKPGHYANGFTIFPWNELDLMAEIICKHVWSPVIWTGGIRKKVNFLRSDFLVLDFDSGAPTMEEAADKFCNYAHIIAPTKSHQKEKDGKPACDRFRLIVPWVSPVKDRAVYEYTLAVIAAKSGADKSAKDAGRFFWPCTSIYSIDPKGMCASTKPLPKEQTEPKKLPWWKHPTKGPVSRETQAFLISKGVIEVGERNPTLYRVALDLLRHGWTPDQVYAAVRDKTNLPEYGVKDVVYRSAVRDYKILPFPKRH